VPARSAGEPGAVHPRPGEGHPIGVRRIRSREHRRLGRRLLPRVAPGPQALEGPRVGELGPPPAGHEVAAPNATRLL
jgi:hypothetical protein